MIWVLVLILQTGSGEIVSHGRKEFKTLEQCQAAADKALAIDERLAAVCYEIPVFKPA